MPVERRPNGRYFLVAGRALQRISSRDPQISTDQQIADTVLTETVQVFFMPAHSSLLQTDNNR